MSKVLIKESGLISKETEDGLLLFSSSSGRMVEFNITAKLMWEKTGESFNVDDLKNIIKDNCDEIMNIDSDIDEYIEKIVGFELVKYEN